MIREIPIMSYKMHGEPVEFGRGEMTPLPTEFREASGGLLRSDELMRTVKNMPKNSLILVNEEFEALDTLGLKGEFVERDDFAYGREESAHGLYFGQLVFNSAGDYEKPEFVAIKPYDDQVPEMVHEFAVNTLMNLTAKDARRAFTPLGIWRDKDGKFSFLTRYEHQVTSFDSVLWADYDLEPRAQEPEIIKKALRMSTFGLGLVHGLGFSHGDAQAKNLGSDNQKLRLIDLEEARRLSVQRTNSENTDSVEKLKRDWDTMVSSFFMKEENVLDIAEKLLDLNTDGAIARSYLRGVIRAKKFNPHDTLEHNLSTEGGIYNFVNKLVSTELERIEP